MNRKEFLKHCAGGICACAVAGSIAPAAAAAEPAKPEDWRLRFVKRRYARLLEILGRRMSADELAETLVELGTCCSAFGDETTIKFRGNLEGYRDLVRKGVSGDLITYDLDHGLITMASEERTDCFCPLLSRAEHASPAACNCSLGWQKHTWETLLQKPVTVTLKESVLRGGKRCVFEIRIGESGQKRVEAGS